MNKNVFEKHLKKLITIKNDNLPLSIYDLRAGIFEEEMRNDKVKIVELIKHKFASQSRSDGKFVKIDKHARAYDYVIGVARYPFDRNTVELMIATVYVSTHSHIKEQNKESYRDNPMYDQRYGIYKIELRAITYNKLHPESGYSVTKYKEI